MFEAADGFVVLPGAIGTLEEAIELISWRRMGLHAKPVVFHSPDGFWTPLFAQFDRFVADDLVPAGLSDCWRKVEAIEAVLPALAAMPRAPAPPLTDFA
jgi:predicted Rossmann-fold nucleotide-binding protein